MIQRVFQTWLALSVFMGGALGCVPVENIDLAKHLDGIHIEAERLRPDFRGLGRQAPISERTTYSDGNTYEENGNLDALGGAPISPLVFADMPGHLVHDLRKAQCLWVEQGNAAGRLSYELVAKNVRPEDGAFFPEVGFCGGFIHDPATRGVLRSQRMDEEEERRAVGVITDSYDVELSSFVGRPSADPLNGCDAGDPKIESLPLQARSLRGIMSIPNGLQRWDNARDYPFCVIQGALGPIADDSSFRFDLMDLDTGLPTAVVDGIDAPPLEIESRIKVVRPSAPGKEFLLSRPLRFEGVGSPEHDADRTRTPYTWTWGVEELGDGRWRENFHPELVISRVRAYVDRGLDPDTGDRIREYLHPRRIRAYTQFETIAPSRHLNCRVEQLDPEAPPACEDVEGFTPTFHRSLVGGRDTLSDRLTWEVRFDEVIERVPVEQPDGSIEIEERVVTPGPSFGANDELFVEFHVVRPTTGTLSNGLSLSPGGRDLGDLKVAHQPKFPDAFHVWNWGQGNLQVLDAWLSGPNANDFELVLEGGLPQTLRPEDEIPIHLRLVGGSQHFGRLEVDVNVRARDAAGRIATAYVRAVANAVDWYFHALHGPLFFERHASQHPHDDLREFEKPLLLINAGSLTMPRGQITITGPSAAHFSVVRRDSETLPPDKYLPWLFGEPPPATRDIEPGDDEWLYVVYHPKHPGQRALRHGADTAEIRVRVDQVDYTIPIVGWCTGTCQFPAPTPVAPPKHGGAVVVMPGVAPPPPGGLSVPHEVGDLSEGR